MLRMLQDVIAAQYEHFLLIELKVRLLLNYWSGGPSMQNPLLLFIAALVPLTKIQLYVS